jgi:hypothetical protein
LLLTLLLLIIVVLIVIVDVTGVPVLIGHANGQQFHDRQTRIFR